MAWSFLYIGARGDDPFLEGKAVGQMKEFTRHQEIRWVTIVFVLSAILLSVGMKRTGFEGRDERRYAQVASEVAWGENLFVMHYLGELYPDKPPLFFWMQAASYKIFGGVSPFSARFPLFIMALASLAFGYLCIRQISGAQTALFATVALLLMFRFFWSARWARLDIPMCAFTFGSFWASSRILFSGTEKRKSTWGWAMLAWIFAALSILAKGPGIISWIGTIAVYATIKRDGSALRDHHPLTGLVLMLAIVGAWLVPAMVLGGPEYYGPMFGIHVEERLLGLVRHPQPFYYFLGKILFDPLPVAILLPAALWYARKSWKSVQESSATLFYLCWFLFSLIFFSIPTGKRGQYILPLYPAVAALIAQFLVSAMREEKWCRVLRRHLWALIAIGFVGGVALILVSDDLRDFPVPPPQSFRVLMFVVLTGLVGAAVLALRKRKELHALGCLAATVWLTYASFFAVVFPLNRDDQVSKDMLSYVQEHCDDFSKVRVFGIYDALAIYGRDLPNLPRPLSKQDAQEFVRAAQGRWLIVPRKDYEQWLRKNGHPGWKKLNEWNYAELHDAILLLESGEDHRTVPRWDEDNPRTVLSQ